MLAEVTLQLSDYGVIAAIVAVATGGSSAFTVFALRRQDSRIAALEEKMEAGQRDLGSDVKALERNKTDRREWARELRYARESYEKISDKLQHIEGKLDNTVGLAAIGNRIMDKLEERRESHAS